MDRSLDEPILIIKTAWGGKSLAVDFLPPRAGPYLPSQREKDGGKIPRKEEVGNYYREMVSFVKATLKDAGTIRKVVPGYLYIVGQSSGFDRWSELARVRVQVVGDVWIPFKTDPASKFF